MEMNFLEIFGTIVGLVYLWLEYRASIYLWIAGIIMPAIYIFVYYKAGLYADFGINIYYLIAAIYGWFFWMWGHRKRKVNSQQMLLLITSPKTFPSCTLHKNVIHLFFRYLSLHLSALPGYSLNTRTAMYHGWIASPRH